MSSFLAEMQGVSEEDMIIENSMWVLSNAHSLNGVFVLLFPEYFEKLAQSLNCDFYILPSSVHEVIAVPSGEMELSTFYHYLLFVIKTFKIIEKADSTWTNFVGWVIWL